MEMEARAMLYRGFVMAMVLILGTIWVAMAAIFVVAVAAAAHRHPLAPDEMFLADHPSFRAIGSCRVRSTRAVHPASN